VGCGCCIFSEIAIRPQTNVVHLRRTILDFCSSFPLTFLPFFVALDLSFNIII